MRRVRSVLAAACAVLCVLVAIAWVRGYFVSETLGCGIRRAGGMLSAGGLMSGRGGVGFATMTGMPYQKEIAGFFYQREPAGYAGGIGKEPARWKALGFMYVRLPTTPFGSGWAVAAPTWSLLLVLAPWPAWRLRTALREGPDRRRRLGLCVHCGYDLRASAERCPECGAAKPASSAPTIPADTVPTAPRN